jgi:hypothetical protein
VIPGGVRKDKACAAPDCNRWARRNGLFCSDACRARTWKRRHPGYHHPPSPAARQNAAERRKPGGLQVSANRMLKVLTSDPLVLPEVQARRAVARAMSEKQRQRFLA